MIRPPPRSPLFPYPPLSRSPHQRRHAARATRVGHPPHRHPARHSRNPGRGRPLAGQGAVIGGRSEEHTSELQSRLHLVCRLLLEKKKQKQQDSPITSNTSRP